MERLSSRCAKFGLGISDSFNSRFKENTYDYRPLGHREIRVLDLELLTDNESRAAPIICYLRHVVLDDDGNEAATRNTRGLETAPYEAVSYVCK